jgi:hypothetical protein
MDAEGEAMSDAQWQQTVEKVRAIETRMAALEAAVGTLECTDPGCPDRKKRHCFSYHKEVHR